MKRFSFSFLAFVLVFVSYGFAQMPKWAKKANKSMLMLVTFDAQGSVLDTTCAIPVEKGIVLTDYHTLKGAARAVVVDVKKKAYPVERIMGCSSLYDVAKCSVPTLKTKPLLLATDDGIEGERVVMLSSSSRGVSSLSLVIRDVQTFNERYAYYTIYPADSISKAQFLMKVDDNSVSKDLISSPVFNMDGEVLGLFQLSSSQKDTMNYVLSTTYGMSLLTTAMSANSADVRDLHIPVALPSEFSQASTFLYLTGMEDTLLYQTYLDDLRRCFPEEAASYTLQAEFYAIMQHYAEADAMWNEGLESKAKKQSSQADEIYFSKARTYYDLIRRVKTCPETWTLDASLQAVRQAKEINPLPVYTSLEAQILYSMADYKAACEGFLALNATNLRTSDQFLYAAQCQMMLKDTLAALALQDSAVAFYTKPYMPAAARPLLMRANTLLALGHYADAVQDLNEYERLERKNLNANFYYKRFQAEMRCRRYQQAADDIESACRLEPEEPLFQAEKAVIYYRFGETDEAIKAARKALELDETFSDAHRILSICFEQQGKNEEAHQHLLRAIELGDEVAKEMMKNTEE